ncbi:alpha/beta hydrolase [Ferrimonas pelagia]|uniref:Alpha/beta fold hydrolase n=1 Tax=Ferrimonas pelagia TaxID=1177826 RepID=A0ABP9F5K4_9GAMM
MSVIPMISARKGFFQSGKRSKRDSIRTVDLVDVRPATTTPISQNALFDQIKGKHIVVIIHGYNNDFASVCSAYQRIINLMTQNHVVHDHVVGYLWPGGDKALGYWSARSRAKKIAQRLGDQLTLLAQHAARVDIIAHSMGCYLTLRALQKSSLSQLGNLCLMAPAVRRNRLSDNRGFALPAKKARTTYVFHSKEDEVLKYAFFVGAGGEKALGYSGPKPFDTVVSNTLAVDCTAQDYDHGSYSKRHEVYQFLAHHTGPTSTAARIPLITEPQSPQHEVVPQPDAIPA